MIFFKQLAVFLALITLNTLAQAQSALENNGNFYVIAGTGSLAVTYGSTSTDLGTTGVVYSGYDFNKYIGIEILTGRASSENNVVKLNFAGVFLKPKFPINDTVEIYGRLGTNSSTLKIYNASVSESTASYGGGLNIYPFDDKKQFFQLGYMTWYKKSGYTIEGAEVSYGRRF